LGDVPVRRLRVTEGALGLRNLQFLDPDTEMQKMEVHSSLIFPFGSSDKLEVLRRENEEEGILSRSVSP
jgi:hypothetical protein